MEFKFQRRRLNELSQSKILVELEVAAKHFNYIEFGRRDFDKIAGISSSAVRKHFGGSWTKALSALKQHLKQKSLDLSPRPHAPNRIYSDKDLFAEMERIWQKLGQRPSRTEWEASDPKIAYQTYGKRFHGWTNACHKFIEYKMGHTILVESRPQKQETDNSPNQNKEDKREISLKLRLTILNRDNFCCVLCGKSPALNRGVTLHIYHKIPFSKGGKSTADNLQTLCSECNLGKSNRVLNDLSKK